MALVAAGCGRIGFDPRSTQGTSDGAIVPCSGAASFGAPHAFPAGSEGWDISAGDIDGDGRLDLAVVNNLNPATVSILRGDGAGGFAAPATITYPGACFAQLVKLADVDRDGAVDLVASIGGGLSVQRGDGHGNFAAPQSYSPGGAGPPDEILVADFDGDGHLDLVAAPIDGTLVNVLYGDGTGAFAPSMIVVNGFPIEAAAGDLDGDGRADLVFANANVIPEQLQLMRSTGRGTFASSVYNTGVAAGLLAIGDLDRDGHLDVIDDLRTGNIAILRGTGTGAVVASSTMNVAPSMPSVLALADLDGDGVLDLVVARESDSTIATFHGNGDATFAPATTYPVPSPNQLAIADIDRDGHLDLAASSRGTSSVQVMLATCR